MRVCVVPYMASIGTSLAALLLGGWLILAPFALGYQPDAGGWTVATANDVWCGAILAVVSLARLLLVGSLLLAMLRAAGVLPAGARRAALSGAMGGNPSKPNSPGNAAIVALSFTAQLPLVAGVWLVVSPWVMQTQRAGATWSAGTIDNVVTGALVLSAALLGVGAALALLLGDALP